MFPKYIDDYFLTHEIFEVYLFLLYILNKKMKFKTIKLIGNSIG